MLVIANLSRQAQRKTFNGKSLMWFTGCCKGEGGSFGSVTLAFVSWIGPHWPLADFPGATYSAGKSQQVKQGPISWELGLKMGSASAKREKKNREVVPVCRGPAQPPWCATHTRNHCNGLVRGLKTSSSVQAVNCSHLQTRTPAALSTRGRGG